MIQGEAFMRYARNLLLLVLTALAAMAMAASSASAQEVEISNEPSGEHCTLDPGNENCVVEAHGEDPTAIIRHFNGVEQPTGVCNDEFEAVIDEFGEGYIQNQELHGGTCFKRNCDASAPEAGDGQTWPIHIEEEDGQLLLHVRFCIESDAAPGVDQFCSVEIPFVETETHHYEFTAIDLPCAEAPGGARNELTGHWVTEESETHDDILIEHIED
jgi:hypothetical protein